MQEQIIQKAKILYDLDRYDGVVDMLHTEMASMEDVQGAWLFSSSLMMLDEMQKALKGTEQGLKIDPEFFPLLLLRAEIYKRLGLHSKASPAIEQALNIAPENSTCHVVASSVFLATNHFGQAIRHADRALSIEPENVYARIVKASVLHLQDHEQEAQELAREAISVAPDNPDAIAFLARLTENRADKVVLLNKALQLNPTDKDQQKEIKRYTTHADRDLLSAVLLMAGALGAWFFTPTEHEHYFFTVMPVIGPMLLLYYSKYIWLASLMLFTCFIFAGIHDPDFFESGWGLQSIVLNLFYILFLACFSILASFVTAKIRIVFQEFFFFLQKKQENYQRAKKFALGRDYLAEARDSGQIYFYLVGAIVIPTLNVVAHHVSTAVFWSCFLFSFGLIHMALVFFTHTPILKAFIPTLLYGFFTILISVFAGAIFETNIITIIACFIGAASATHLIYIKNVSLKDRT